MQLSTTLFSQIHEPEAKLTRYPGSYFAALDAVPDSGPAPAAISPRWMRSQTLVLRQPLSQRPADR